VRKFTGNHNVIPVTRENLMLIDFHSVKEWLRSVSPDIVINCATATTKFQVSEQNFNDLQNNLSIFLNFYNNSDLFGRFINIGSGAEFDRYLNINLVNESQLFHVLPEDSYGYSKNVISRLVLEKANFYTLRLFGCFDHSEPKTRLFQLIASNKDILLEQRQVDYISLKDFSTILEYYLNNTIPYKDINCVYPTKVSLDEIYGMFKTTHNLTSKVKIVKINELNYTGNGDKLETLPIKLDGLLKGIQDYL
jgi:nucleoside-diphosphate-sugar epimerase